MKEKFVFFLEYQKKLEKAGIKTNIVLA